MTGKTHLTLSLAAGTSVLVALQATRLLPPLFAALDAPVPRALDVGALLVVGGLLGVCVVGGWFPDLDAPESELLYAPRTVSRRLGRTSKALWGRHRGTGRALVAGSWTAAGAAGGGLLRGISWLIRRGTHHRGFTHTAAGCVLFTALALLGVGLLFVLGGSTAGDAATAAVRAGGLWAVGYLAHLGADAATLAGIPLWGRPWHLLPAGHRIRTGTAPDTHLVRGLALIWALAMCGVVLVS
ncbi:MAG TPA: metal-dependent hydrolase [Chloroflexia bacterium]|nr:metal-dependent hydrolase [Chloroflexia bacterium]